MYKAIPGNVNYSINLTGEVVDYLGNKIELKKASDGDVVIEMFGKPFKLSLQRLSLLAWFEVNAINHIEQHLHKIGFSEAHRSLKSRSGYIMFFHEPIYYNGGFRYIPGYHRYAINESGVVIDTRTNLLAPEFSIRHGYKCHSLYYSNHGKPKIVQHHRLMALAWIPNTNFLAKPIINHIDGDRLNNTISNLEWCDHAHNNRHALETGLNCMAIKMKTRDVVTGEVLIHQSMVALAEFFKDNNAKWHDYTNRLEGYLYKKRYEIKNFNDDSPWYYEINEIDPDGKTKAIYTITVTNLSTKESETLINLRTFCKKYKIWTTTMQIDVCIAAFNTKYPGFIASYKKNCVSGPYQAVNIVDKQITIFNSILKVANHIGRTRTEIQFDLSRGLKYIYSKKWVVCPGMEPADLSQYTHKKPPFSKIEVVDKYGNITVYDSIRHLRRAESCNHKTISLYLDKGKPCSKGNIYRTVES